MHVCCKSPYVFAVRDSVGGRALPCPQHHSNGATWRLEDVLFSACMWVLQCGVHGKVGKGDSKSLRGKCLHCWSSGGGVRPRNMLGVY